MNTIYRLRPYNEKTINELKNSYLWFSRPTEYNDVEDSNVIAFVNNNESIKDSFERIFSDYKELGQEAEFTGICCFTESLPNYRDWKHFPKGSKGIFIEYDKDVLERFFHDTMGIGDCFKRVDYSPNPLVFNSYSKYDIEWERTEDGTIYKALRCIEKDIKLKDMLFLKMFTRISDKFKKQNELRVILGGRNIPDKNCNLKGYKIPIPKHAFLRIFIHQKSHNKIKNELSDCIVEVR